MRFITSDRYENVLGGLGFGYMFLVILLTILFFPQQSEPVTLNHFNGIFGVFAAGVVYIWMLLVVFFWVTIIRRGRRIIKERKKIVQAEKQEKQLQSANYVSNTPIINYDKIHEEALKDSQKTQRKEDKNEE